MGGIKLIGCAMLIAGVGMLAYAVMGLMGPVAALNAHAAFSQVVLTFGLVLIGTILFACGLIIALFHSPSSPKHHEH